MALRNIAPRRALIAAFVAVAVVCVAGCSSTDSPAAQPKDAATAEDSPDGPVTAEPACADPQDCRLRELGEAAGLQVGFLVTHEDEGQARIGAAEATVFVNHGISWNSVEKVRGTYEWAKPDARAAWARENGLDQIGMHLYWEGANIDDAPDWLPSITDPEELRSVLRERARAVFERYPDLYRITVLNEPLETLGSVPYDNHFRRVLGPDYAIELFEIAAAEAPDTTELVLNENLTEYSPAKADSLVAMAEQLVKAGAGIDVVGLQSHLVPLESDPDWALMRETMQRIGALGLKVYVSELDVPVIPEVPDRATVQAERYRKVAATCLSVAACDAIVIWGITDRDTWIDWFLAPGLAPLLFDESLRPKPAYEAFREALAAGRTDEAPSFATPTTSTATSSPPG